MDEPLPDSKTHRLAFFKGAPEGGKHVPVEHYIADEVEELRAFVQFLFPQRGQDRFKLNRPDALEPRWSVSARGDDGILHTYASGDSPRLAVHNARLRLTAEDEAERTKTPFSLEPQPEHD